MPAFFPYAVVAAALPADVPSERFVVEVCPACGATLAASSPEALERIRAEHPCDALR